MKDERPADLIGFLSKARWHAALGLAVAIVIGIAGMLATRTSAPSQTPAIAMIGVTAHDVKDQPQATRQTAYFILTLSTAARLGTSEDVLAPVATQFGYSVPELQSRLRLRVPPATQVIEILYMGIDPDEAVKVTDALSEQLLSTMKRIETQPENVALTYSIVQKASLYVEPQLAKESIAAALQASGQNSRSAVTRLALIGGGALLAGVLVMATSYLIAQKRTRQE